ncbi:MAG TPA: hydrogenase maturation peptidase HycI [Patescibacteria group bacterium]|nr:hydrogenase maturation peptidase HycI [Patescibacteria group bacterium]
MESLKTSLKKQLSRAQRIALLGVGSELRGDDAAGILVAKRLAADFRGSRGRQKFKVFIGATAPENVTGQIKKFKPGQLIIIDAADMNAEAGAVKLIPADRIDGFSSCTHSLPLNILADYLVKSIGCAITIIGIQPKTLAFGSRFSPEVERSAGAVCAAIGSILGRTTKTDV